MKFKKDYECKKCGSKKVYAKPISGGRYGAFCDDCGERITYIKYNELAEINKQYRESCGEKDNVAFKSFRKYDTSVRMTCSNCGCLLYNSAFPKIKGQFNLVDAKFCPYCGKELI